MGPEEIPEPIRTPRLELIPISAAFVRALVDDDRDRASTILGAVVSRWLSASSAHVVQLAVAQEAAGRALPAGSARVLVVDHAGSRRAIGSIGFFGPPDERGRLEVGCRVHPSYRGHGYAGEAMTAMFEWAGVHLGVTRFLVAVASAGDPSPRLVAELELTGRAPTGDRIAELDAILDATP